MLELNGFADGLDVGHERNDDSLIFGLSNWGAGGATYCIIVLLLSCKRHGL